MRLNFLLAGVQNTGDMALNQAGNEADERGYFVVEIWALRDANDRGAFPSTTRKK